MHPLLNVLRAVVSEESDPKSDSDEFVKLVLETLLFLCGSSYASQPVSSYPEQSTVYSQLNPASPFAEILMKDTADVSLLVHILNSHLDFSIRQNILSLLSSLSNTNSGRLKEVCLFSFFRLFWLVRLTYLI